MAFRRRRRDSDEDEVEPTEVADIESDDEDEDRTPATPGLTWSLPSTCPLHRGSA